MHRDDSFPYIVPIINITLLVDKLILVGVSNIYLNRTGALKYCLGYFDYRQQTFPIPNWI